mmetsp:Transcript_4602/g.16197  ORF Transcript_4602/g.16197 Transcript_4602/m.16197 type:complete len:214 (+) Transcript_4602:97-738(+)
MSAMTYVRIARAAVHCDRSSSFSLSMVSATVWWYQKYLPLSVSSSVTGMPASCRGSVSAPPPPSTTVMLPKPRSFMRSPTMVSSTSYCAPERVLKVKPVGVNTPMSLSIPSMWLATSSSDRESLYASAPRPPFSSFTHPMARMVRRGWRPASFSTRRACHAAMMPPPSSIAPVPTSQESVWPPTTTTFSGNSLPMISPMTLCESVSFSISASM